MEYIVGKMRDKIRQYEKIGIPTYTNFLTPAEMQEALTVLRGYPFVTIGGYAEAERRIVVIGDEKEETIEDRSQFVECAMQEYLAVLRIKNENGNLTHRSVLGSILGLGIKREKIGDILVHDNECDVIVLKEMKEFLLQNLIKVGRDKVQIAELPWDKLWLHTAAKQQKVVFLASLRLDGIVSNVYDIARDKSNGIIQEEKVLVNFLLCTNPSKTIHEQDIISVRGHGRFKVLEVIGETKKGRLKVLVEIY